MYYTCKFPVGQYVYPLINVGGPRVVGPRTCVKQVQIIHDTDKGLAVYYHADNGVVYSNEDELFGDEIDARRAMKERNARCVNSRQKTS